MYPPQDEGRKETYSTSQPSDISARTRVDSYLTTRGEEESGRTISPYPVFVRPTQNRVLGGVAAGLAQHIGWDTRMVRIGLLLLVMVSGLGLALYLALWAFTPAEDESLSAQTQHSQPRTKSENTHHGRNSVWLVVLVGVFFVLKFGNLPNLIPVGFLAPLVLTVGGLFIAWMAYDRGVGSWGAKIAVIVGAILMLGGIIVGVVLWNLGTGGFGTALITVILTVLGILFLTAPLLMKIWRQIVATETARVAADQRAEMASHLHDSVLQTLALIQKRAEDSGEVTRLARGQERELRQWLFDPPVPGGRQFFQVLNNAAAEIEDRYGVSIAPVCVGHDLPLDEKTELVAAAAREAIQNAARHSGQQTVNVYAENTGDTLEVYVRDRGVGFELSEVAPHRHGIRDSIYGRMQRIGGQAEIHSAPGEGTEISLVVPLA
ncbi:PspC domain-containing protein [Corynebacterium poyangense]|uniref:PspC domain-containing protein n=1 Tax=Corynebacterium poyangense TaxID=2684405 RepID=A0A7H0SMB2_9CORY|nr:ATP-binding protein [Corynebacterium poyangense]QNQ89687.1 PspC domain-containing protein [Corynebacterium poyangense]